MYIKRDEIIGQLDKIPFEDIEKGFYPDFEVLIYAIMKKNIDLFKKVIEKIDEKEDFYRLLDFSKETQSFSILHLATIENCIEAVKILLEYNKIIPDVKTKQGITPLMIAAKKGFFEIASILIERGADINITSKTKNTPLIFASSVNNVENYKIVKMLVEKGADINFQNKKGNTALISSSTRSKDIYNFLIENGADISIVNKEGKTAEDYMFDNIYTENEEDDE